MVKIVLVLSITSLIFVGLAFGIGFEIGGGVNYFGIPGIGLMIPTVCGGVVFPLFGDFSITGQGDMLMFSSGNSSNTMFMLLGGARYTFGSKGIMPFVGADAGVLTTSSDTVPVFGINGGMIFNLLGSVNGYVKGAFRVISMGSGNPSEGPTMLTLQLMELTGGAYILF